MSGGERLSGKCLCGAVRFTAAPEKAEMGVCHCGMCRRWTGGVFLGVNCGSTVKVEGKDNLGVYVSSDWGERCFCKKCGSTLFWRLQNGRMTVVSAQAFDNPADFAFTSEIFIDEKPANYAFANQTHKMTGAEVMAMFAPKS
jgi:hypothetical protein